MTYQQILGRRIRNFRKRAKLSQMELEGLINASPGYLSRVENGEINPTKETIYEIIKALKLNERESEYLAGLLFYAADENEIRKAIEEVKDYFNKKGVMAYMLDDRNRFICMSKSFLGALGFSQWIADKYYLKVWPCIILDDEIGIKERISPPHYEDMIFNILERFYNDVYFMSDDENCLATLKSIEKHDLANKIWSTILKNPPKFRTSTHRTIYFRFHGLEIPLTYSVESLLNLRRFEIVEYTVNNKFLRHLSKYI